MKSWKKLKPWWKGIIIGGLIGLVLFLYLNNFCIRYSIRERILLSSFFTCYGIQGGNCCAIAIQRVMLNFLVWIMVPACCGAFIYYIISKFKK